MKRGLRRELQRVARERLNKPRHWGLEKCGAWRVLPRAKAKEVENVGKPV